MTPLRILHLADVHLDRPFVGLPREAARRRRRDLWEAFRRCLAAARDHGVELVTVGGDLWEEENVTADTRRSVAHELGLVNAPVLIACGNHDPLLPGGNYGRTPWPTNVHLFETEEPSEYRADGVSIWGVSWRGGQLTADFLERFRTPDDGRIHLLLLHGTAQGGPYPEGDAYCAFDPQRVVGCGFALCLAGHIHAASERPGLVYPGSPEPLSRDEMGRHCYALIEVESDGSVQTELHDVNRHRYERVRLDCSGAASSAEVAERLAGALVHPDGETIFLCVELVGEPEPDTEIDSDELAAVHSASYAGLEVEDSTTRPYDLDALAVQQTARGRFVRRLREQMNQAEHEEKEKLEMALLAGLRALDGREHIL